MFPNGNKEWFTYLGQKAQFNVSNVKFFIRILTSWAESVSNNSSLLMPKYGESESGADTRCFCSVSSGYWSSSTVQYLLGTGSIDL